MNVKPILKFITITVGLLIFYSCDVSNDDNGNQNEIDNESPLDNWVLQWSDEFTSSEIDSSKWNYDIGTDGDGWGNAELQYYTDRIDNSYIEDGNLVLKAIEEEYEGSSYTSARLNTYELQSFRYGKIETRAKLPKGQGLWPAIWLLGNNYSTDDWPYCGEIDMVELVGGSDRDNIIHGTAHWFNETNDENDSLGESYTLSSGDFADDYHIFSIIWDHESIEWYIDDELYHTVDISPAEFKEFSRGFYLIVNVAVGGHWPGSPDNTTELPQEMYIDYIRYYTDSTFEPAAETVISDDEKPGAEFYPDILDPSFTPFTEGSFVKYGPNSPEITQSEISAVGDYSVAFNYPGDSWGGAYIELVTATDLSIYAENNLVFYAAIDDTITDFELKMESTGGSTSLFIINYTPEVYDENFVKYSIPLADFIDVNLEAVTIPFSIWNPNGGDGAGTILIDGLTIE